MRFWQKLGSLFAPTPAPDPRSLWLYVRCHKCGEVVRSRVDLMNDLSLRDEAEGGGYFCRKVLIGSRRCYQPIEAALTFDRKKNLAGVAIRGGTQATEADYRAQNPPM